MMRFAKAALLVSSVLAGACGNDDFDQSIDSLKACPCEVNWQIDNIAICGAESEGSSPPFVTSTYLASGVPACGMREFPPKVPSMAWTAQRISASCAGEGQLCFQLRAGDAEAPSPSDCVLARQCVPFTYPGDDSTLELPPFDGWAASDEACLAEYESSGGYFEFTTDAPGLGCPSEDGGLPTRRVPNCPLSCATDPNQDACRTCSQSFGGGV